VEAAPELLYLNLVLAELDSSPIVLSVAEEAYKAYEQQDKSCEPFVKVPFFFCLLF
jgi:hypothetical protein